MVACCAWYQIARGKICQPEKQFSGNGIPNPNMSLIPRRELLGAITTELRHVGGRIRACIVRRLEREQRFACQGIPEFRRVSDPGNYIQAIRAESCRSNAGKLLGYGDHAYPGLCIPNLGCGIL